MTEGLKSFLFTIYYLIKTVGIKDIADMRRRFGNPDISMPFNSEKIEWDKAIQKVCREKNFDLNSISYKIVSEENSSPREGLMTYIWFLLSKRHILIAKEYRTGNPVITLGQCKSFNNKR